MENSPDIQQYLTLLADRDAWNHWRSKNRDVPLNFARIVLNGVNLSESDVRDINFTRANLSASKFHKADCRRTCFAGANLKGTDLGGADLRAANLKWANLARTNLMRANLSDANLSGADLTGANLSGAEIQGANLDGVKLTGAVMPDGSLYGIVTREIVVELPEAETIPVTPESTSLASEAAITGSASLDQLLTESIVAPALEGEIFPIASTNGKHRGSITQLR